jgi:hypothetical protein
MGGCFRQRQPQPLVLVASGPQQVGLPEGSQQPTESLGEQHGVPSGTASGPAIAAVVLISAAVASEFMSRPSVGW